MHSSSPFSLLSLSLSTFFPSQPSSVLSPLPPPGFVLGHVTVRCHRGHSLFFTLLFIFLFRTLTFPLFFCLSHLSFLCC
ncbi:hypothetical protein I7I48_10566 [Histoplasma ohiense]|nr:hypothetical protein I7I48_10566 [Histoplasma ohiense (nom. inval.)]